MKSCSQSFACPAIFRQATRQDSPPGSMRASPTSQPVKISTEASQGHSGPCWLFTSVKHAEDERMQAGSVTHFERLIWHIRSCGPAVCE